MGALDNETLTMLTVVALATVVVLAATVVLLALLLGKLRRQLSVTFADGPGDAVEHLARQSDELAAVRQDLTTVHANAERLHEGLQTMLSRVGLVRYDAFDDVAGAQSFSAALLDLNGDGLVISAINGRHETRCYGKQVSGGKSQHTLSEEEATAITAAMERRDVITLPSSSSRKRRSN